MGLKAFLLGTASSIPVYWYELQHITDFRIWYEDTTWWISSDEQWMGLDFQ